jgi:DNA-binding response OmpR family regulator
MYFFVAMAALVVLCDWRPIALAAGLIALHHLALENAQPGWVFTGSGNIGRVVIHAVAVGLELSVLSYVTTRLRGLMIRQEVARSESEALANEAIDSRNRMEAAIAGLRAAEAREAVSSVSYAAMILDLGLPDGDGLSVLRELRRLMEPLPVLVLTARGGLQDRVSGLRSGADDYLAKPFAMEELVARLEAIMRRPGQLLGRSLRLANLVYDTESRQIFVDDQPRIISAREASVLEILLRRQGRVVPKKNVEDHIFGLDGEVASNAVEVYVSRLRKQLTEHGARVVIHTIRGVGYLMAEEK